ncbi:MAG: RHS repeat protein [Polyangiaceae bacterium]|nr:RHS repeat protein [Polyangiaceae bacterium]
MARTAPVPNIPPIPGMCPSIAVLGGGAGGGGGSGNGTGDGDGNGPDNGNGNGDGANGDGRNAGGCGAAGGASGCSHCSPGVAAGHPVDVVTGRSYTNPAHDLVLPGPLPLVFTRRYSSTARKRDLGIGHGWCHSFSWRIWVRRSDIVLLTDDGRMVEFPLLEPGDVATSPGGWKLRRDDTKFTLLISDGALRTFHVAQSSPVTYLLASVADPNGNVIRLEYDYDRLSRIVDSVGREIRFESTSDGRTKSMSVLNAASQGAWVTFATYGYGPDGDLVQVIDADGHAWEYGYTNHLLTLERDPTGLAFHFRYDDEGRCFETWGDYPEREDISLAGSVPAVLADGVTKARGVHHVKIVYASGGYTEVSDSLQVRRFFGNKHGLLDKAVDQGGVVTRRYDEHGRPAVRIDAMGGTTTYQWNRAGLPLRIVDPGGRSYSFEYDTLGRLAAASDAGGGRWELTRDARGNIVSMSNPRGARWTWQYDARGLPRMKSFPTGGVERLTYDAHGNLIERVDPNGGAWRFTYDFFGRCTSRTDPTGGTVRVAYATGGRPVRTTDALGAQAHYQWDGVGQLRSLVDVDGGVFRYEWGGYRRKVATIFPNGETLRELYDREGNKIVIVNEVGETHDMQVDARGRVLSETTFDGRVLSYRYDKLGRIIEETDAARRRTRYEYTASGDLAAVDLPDGSKEEYAYTPRGDLASVAGPGYRLLFDRDEVGNIITERQELGDAAEVVSSKYDLLDERIERVTSRGHALQLARDAFGFIRQALLDDREEIAFDRNGAGDEIRRTSSRGAAIHTEVDSLNQLTRRWLELAPGGTSSGQPAPFDGRYSYSPDGEIASRWDSRGSNEYEYDPRKRLLGVTRQRGTLRSPGPKTSERFKYDPASNVYADGVPTSYRKGGVLERRGNTAYRWDENHRLVEKRVSTEAGAEEVWQYGWSARGQLATVTRPDGSRVELIHDAFGRRLSKRIVGPPRAGGKVVSNTRFVWDQGTMVHEIRRRAAAADDPVIQERTYWIEGGQVPTPVVHRDKLLDDGTSELRAQSWLHYVNDVTGMPEQLVSGDGRITEDLEHSAWGRVDGKPAHEGTPLRFSGQYEDAETGLYYNRHRYYDPETGLYISPDPIGLTGGTNPFRYGNNPVSTVDPFGTIWRDGVWVNTAHATLTPAGSTRGRMLRNPDAPPGSPDPFRWENEGNGGLHTEGRIIENLRGRPDSETRGATLGISGDFHACEDCQRDLANFARERGMRIEYYGNHDTSRPRGPGAAGMFRVDHRPGANPSGVLPEA